MKFGILPTQPPAKTGSQTELTRTGTGSTTASGTTIPEPTRPSITPATSNAIGPGTTPSTATTPSSAAFLRTRSNSALPKLTTSVSTHLPWKSSGTAPRNRSAHRPSHSMSGPGVATAHKSSKLHLPHVPHASHSQAQVPTQKTLFGRQGGAGAVTLATSPLASELQLPAATSAEPSKSIAMMDLGKRISNRLYQSKSAGGSSASLGLDGAYERQELANWLENEEREKRKAEARHKEIDSVYQRVTEVATQASGKLDTVFYSILEKMAQLKSTIRGLQEVFDQSKGLSTQFDSNSEALKRDVQEQAEQFHGFKEQSERIDRLQARIKRSKDKMDHLSDRLEAARETVRKLENQEAEVQRSISFQFRLVYICLGVLLAIFLSTMLMNLFAAPASKLKSSLSHPAASHTLKAAANTTTRHAETSSLSHVKESPSLTAPNEGLESWVDYILALSGGSSNTVDVEVCTASPGIEDDDPRLRLFDEL